MWLIMLLRSFIAAAVRIYEFLLVARAIVSWISQDLSNPVVNFLYTVTEPMLAPVRSLMFKLPFFANCPIDFSMLVVFMILEVIQTVL